MSSLERLGEAGWLQDVRSEESLAGQACNQPGAGPIPFHAFRRACAFYSLSLPFAAWWSPEESKDMGARARTVRVRPSWSVWQRARRAQMGGMEVSAGGHKSDCRSTAGEDQQGLRLCGLEGRRCMQ